MLESDPSLRKWAVKGLFGKGWCLKDEVTDCIFLIHTKPQVSQATVCFGSLCAAWENVTQQVSRFLMTDCAMGSHLLIQVWRGIICTGPLWVPWRLLLVGSRVDPGGKLGKQNHEDGWVWGKELQTRPQQQSSQDLLLEKKLGYLFFLALPTERCIKQKMTCQHVERLGSEGPQKGGNSEVKNMAEACRSAEYIVKICFIL